MSFINATSDNSICQSFVPLIGLDYVRLGMIRPEASERAQHIWAFCSIDVIALRNADTCRNYKKNSSI
jgi:hypothetical protein